MAAPAVARVVSALLDVALLGGIDVVVVYLTTQMAGLPVADVATLAARAAVQPSCSA